MVIWASLQTLLYDQLLVWVLLAQKAPQIPLKRLDGPTRVKVLAAMTGLVILGFGMVALVWLGGRFTRRYMNSSVRSSKLEDMAEDWSSKPLVQGNPLRDADEE